MVRKIQMKSRCALIMALVLLRLASSIVPFFDISRRKAVSTAAAGLFTTAITAPTRAEATVTAVQLAAVPDAEQKSFLWNTKSGQALPATPQSLKNIIKSEMFGAVGEQETPTSGVICVSERHDDLQQHVVQVRVVQTLRKVLKERRDIDSSSTTATADSDQFDSEISIGMECFQRQHQEYLDKYIGSEQKAGEKLYTINDLKNDVSWDST